MLCFVLYVLYVGIWESGHTHFAAAAAVQMLYRCEMDDGGAVLMLISVGRVEL